MNSLNQGTNMKKTLLAIALFSAINANATWPTNELTQSQSLNQHASGGTATVSTGGDVVSIDAEKNAVSSAVAPTVMQSAICPIVSPSSHAVQLLVFGGSTTGGQTLNAECVAWHLGQHDVLERMTCDKSAEYRKANKKCEQGK